MKKILLTLLLLCTVTGAVAQAETLTFIEPNSSGLGDITIMASECIRSYTLTINPKSGGVIQASGGVSCNNKASKIVVTVRIQEKQNGSWVTVATAPGGTVTDAYSHAVTTSYNGTVGKEYRSTLDISVTYNGTTETRSAVTSTKTAVK